MFALGTARRAHALRCPQRGRDSRLGAARRRSLPAIAILLPEDVRRAAGAVQRARDDEQQVGKPVQIDSTRRRHGVVRRERDQLALGASADGARDVRECRSARAAGQDEFLQHRQIGVVMLDGGLEPLDVRGADRRMTRNRQFAAEVEKIVLDVGEQRPDVRRQRFGEHDADLRVELVHGTDRVDARAVLRHARAVAKACRAGVAGARDDAGKPMTHAFSFDVRCGGMTRRSCKSVPDTSEIRTPGQAGTGSILLRLRHHPRAAETNMASQGIFDAHLDRCPANCAALSPLSFIARTAAVWPQRTAVVHGSRRYTWADTYARARRLASALAHRGIGVGDTVAVMLSNTPEMIECHFGVPMTGGVLNTLNTRLDAEAIAFMLGHGEAKVLITDTEFAPTIGAALSRLATKPLVIDVVDALGPGGDLLGESDYETFIAKGDPDFAWRPPADEWDAIALNYTSGTTGNPKGVVYHHRGAYLNALSNIVDWGMPRHSVYLWTLPMFHCNGWCFPWTMAANAGTNVCLRRVEAAAILEAIRAEKVTHYCGAPIV